VGSALKWLCGAPCMGDLLRGSEWLEAFKETGLD